jgi:hypothetical protein
MRFLLLGIARAVALAWMELVEIQNHAVKRLTLALVFPVQQP